IGVDTDGNSYISGGFTSTANFDGLTVSSAGKTDLFLAKYNAAGAIQWVKRAGGLLDDASRGGSRLAVDRAGNFYVHGPFQDGAVFESTVLTSKGGNDVFTAKFNSQGNLLWVRQAGGLGDETDFAGAIAVDS